jgi:Na+-translocating ferredoxin:NAD+ oxidoreductase RnfD subunit
MLEDGMADHGPVEYATAEGNDLPSHEAMYDRFVHLVVVGSAAIVNLVLGLAIGAVAGHWLVAFGNFVVAIIVAFHGLLSGARAPSMVMLLVALVALALTSGGASAS